MPAWQACVTALLTVGVLALLLRWAFGGRPQSLVARLPTVGSEDEYGLMVAVASPATFVEGEVARLRLTDAGVRASLVPTSQGPRLMVLESDLEPARQVLAG